MANTGNQRDNSPSPLCVFLDTNALPRHPAHLGKGFERLCKLAEYGVVKIYLSEVVVEEWKSQLYREFAEHIEKALKVIQETLKHPWLSESPTVEHVNKVYGVLSSSKNEIAVISDSRFSALLASMKAEILPIAHAHTVSVMKSYFSGMPPFKTIKNREDFPDAFIFECANTLVERLDCDLFCITADNNLKIHLAKNGNTNTYENINSFVQSDVVKQAVRRIAPERHWQEILERIRPLLPAIEEQLKSILKAEEPYLDHLNFKEVSHHSIQTIDDKGYALIEGVYEPEEISFDWENIDDFGTGSISLPVTFECRADILLDIFRSDAYCGVPRGVKVFFGDPEEDHYFEASAAINIYVSTILVLTFDLETEPEENLPELESVSVDTVEEISVIENSEGGIFLSKDKEF